MAPRHLTSLSQAYGFKDVPLQGYQWKNHTMNALFAVTLIAVVALIGCLMVPQLFRCVYPHKRQYSSSRVYLMSIVCVLVYFIFDIIIIACQESEAVRMVYTFDSMYPQDVSYNWFIIFPFPSLFWRLSELLLFYLVLRIVYLQFYVYPQHPGKLTRTMPGWTKAFVVILSIIQAIDFGFECANYADLRVGVIYFPDSDYFGIAAWCCGLIYYSLWTPYAVLILVASINMQRRQRSKITLIFVTAVTPALLLRVVFSFLDVLSSLVIPSDYYYNESGGVVYDYTVAHNLDLACALVYVIATLSIYFGLAFIGMEGGLKRDPAYESSEQVTRTSNNGRVKKSGLSGTDGEGIELPRYSA